MSPIFELNGQYYFYLKDDNGQNTDDLSMMYSSRQEAAEAYDVMIDELDFYQGINV